MARSASCNLVSSHFPLNPAISSQDVALSRDIALPTGSLGAGMSCLANYDVEQGDAFVSYFPEADTTIGQAKECAQQCQLYGRCDGFTLSYSRGCELRTGRFFSDFPYVPTSPYEAASSPVVYTPSNDVVLSCLKNAVDFEGAGRYGSAQISGACGHRPIWEPTEALQEISNRVTWLF